MKKAVLSNTEELTSLNGKTFYSTFYITSIHMPPPSVIKVRSKELFSNIEGSQQACSKDLYMVGCIIVWLVVRLYIMY